MALAEVLPVDGMTEAFDSNHLVYTRIMMMLMPGGTDLVCYQHDGQEAA
ncbi:hypothetical protein [Ottowia sp. VDI28]